MPECPHYNTEKCRCEHPKYRKLDGCWECPMMAKLDAMDAQEMEDHQLYDLED